MRSLGQIPAVMDEAEAYTNLSESLKIAEAATRQLAFMRQSDKQGAYWMVIANQLGTLREGVQKLMHASIKNRFRLAGDA